MLHTLGQEELERSLFPIGEQTKDETRAHARRLGLPVAGKPDSQELCFVPRADGGAFLEERAPHLVREGEMVDADGLVVGTHAGAHRFTIGQRRGLGVSLGERAYVVDVDAAANRVVVGPGELLARKGLLAESVHWVGTPPAGPIEAEAQIRYNAPAVPSVVEPLPGDDVRVTFRAPQRAIAPGQSVVFYAADELLGGGTIARSLR
ncbi:MAG TPA: aminomethyltransferase beta-barrel domain-containing protein, partial [Actinomycetota bacterium]